MIGAVFAVRAIGESEDLPVIQMDKIERSKIDNGSYIGEKLGKLVMVLVDVKVSDKKIDIIILKHDNGFN